MKKWIEDYARLVITRGINVQKDQPVVIQAQINSRKLVQALTAEAYNAGASFVQVLWNDEQCDHENYLHGKQALLNAESEERGALLSRMAKEGAGFIRVESDDPNLMADVFPAVLSQRRKAWVKAAKDYRDGVTFATLAWTIVPWPSKAWAVRVYPDLAPKKAYKQLESDIRHILYLDTPDPLKAWDELDTALKARMKKLNDANLKGLKIKTAHGSKLDVRLPEGYVFEGGSSTLKNGVRFFANMPTQEIFSAPLKTGLSGTAAASRPLIHNGVLIDGLKIRFDGGYARDIEAKSGLDTLMSSLAMDDGARFTGEIALVDDGSVISQMNRIFLTTLIDENAACHIALGDSYPETIENGLNMSPEELESKGMNRSDIHIDFMIGDSGTSVSGYDEAGNVMEIMKDGRFVV